MDDYRDWFDIKAVVKIGQWSFPFLLFRDHILNDNREFKLPDDSIFILPAEWFSRYKDFFRLGIVGKKGIRISRSQVPMMQQNAKIPGLDEQPKTEEPDLEEHVALPDDLNAKLRPYQLDGFHWMHQLKTGKFGGCLADDMGLGKTLQALTLLLHSKEKDNHKKEVQNS